MRQELCAVVFPLLSSWCSLQCSWAAASPLLHFTCGAIWSPEAFVGYSYLLTAPPGAPGQPLSSHPVLSSSGASPETGTAPATSQEGDVCTSSVRHVPAHGFSSGSTKLVKHYIKYSLPCFLGQNWDDKRGKMYLVCVRKEAVHRAWDFHILWLLILYEKNLSTIMKIVWKGSLDPSMVCWVGSEDPSSSGRGMAAHLFKLI